MAESPAATVSFRFYEELNDFLPPERRQQEFVCTSPPRASVKHMIEALGVPHTEVELVLVNGESVAFDRLLADGDRVAVYPVFEALDVASLVRVREQPLRETRFIADAHLGALAHLLRLFGFDTLYDNHFDDEEIARIASGEHRIVLTRDRGLLMRSQITHGCYVRALHPEDQLRELVDRLDLAGSSRPFTRCLQCNGPLRAADAHHVAQRVPPAVLARHARFARCEACDRVYWEGTHWRRMSELVGAVLGAGRGCESALPHDRYADS